MCSSVLQPLEHIGILQAYREACMIFDIRKEKDDVEKMKSQSIYLMFLLWNVRLQNEDQYLRPIFVARDRIRKYMNSVKKKEKLSLRVFKKKKCFQEKFGLFCGKL